HDHVVKASAGERHDPYYWLRDDSRSKPEVLDYLRAENRYYDAVMAPHKPLEDKLFNEMVSRIQQDDSSAPLRDRDFWYYMRFEQGKDYPIVARRKGNMDAPEQMMLDGNALAKGLSYYRLSAWEVSPNQQLLAYSVDSQGRYQNSIRVRDLSTGTDFPETITGASPGIAWAADNKSFFYVENDPVTLLSFRVKRHLLGTDPAKDITVYEEQDKSFYTSVYLSGDRQYIIISLNSTVSSEQWVIPANRPDDKPVRLAVRERDFEYSADHIDQRWVIRTNWQAPNFRIMTVADGQIGERSNWRELVTHNDQVFIEEMALFKDHLAIGERSDGLRRLRIIGWDKGQGGEPRYVEMDEPAYTAVLDANPMQSSDWLRYSYTSLTTPTSIYELNLKTGERRLVKRDPVLGGFDPADYQTERVWVTVRDGSKVPVSLVYRRGFKRDGSAPMLQYAYGSYGASMDPYFSKERLSLLDRGFVYALAHVRGGQELGRRWYDNGKLLNKKNTFTDFIDVTEFLVKQQYAAKDRVFAQGGSAGGLLMGAVANMKPEFYRGMIASVPFVDVVTTMLDESIPLTTNEFDEWGNPKEKQYYDYMLSYSPYDNVSRQAYPALLVSTGLHDSQVQYYEPAKWVAKLRALKTDSNPLLFRINMEAGHGGKSGRFQKLRETAKDYSFLLAQLGRVD
ncbi:MAG TPA: S9 family peptidase, partial [Permianibacter sp.]|nr:S9 family peptidase [Permianibacter sp.]